MASPSVTARERELVDHLASGMALKEAAKLMYIAPSSAKELVQRAKLRLGLQSTYQLIAEVVRAEEQEKGRVEA